MSIFTAFVREAANYTHLSSIHQLRQLLDLGHILPSPNDGIITPVSFKVKRLGLRGFLQALDRAEDGERLLTGEWVVSKKTWKRLQTQTLARRQRHHHLGPEHGFGGPASSAHGLGDEKVIFYIHGGAYFVMSASTHRPITISIAKYTECRLFGQSIFLTHHHSVRHSSRPARHFIPSCQLSTGTRNQVSGAVTRRRLGVHETHRRSQDPGQEHRGLW